VYFNFKKYLLSELANPWSAPKKDLNKLFNDKLMKEYLKKAR
jgi:hypothetical protein